MKKSFSSTLVLTGVFLLVFGWYMVWEKRMRPDREKKQDEAKELIQIDANEVQEILVEREKLPAAGSKEAKGESTAYETLRMKRTNDRWELVEPIADPGDDAAIANMATTATTQKYDTIIQEDVKDFKPYGLEPAKIKITIVKDQNNKGIIWLGNDTPVGYSSYARKPEAPILYQTNKALRTAFERKIDELREKKIVDWIRADVAEMEIKNGSTETLVRRSTNDETWNLARLDLPVDNGEWNKSINAVLELRATEFASDNPKDLAKFGLTNPHLTVTLTKSDGKTRFHLTYGKVKDKFYAKRDDRKTIYEVSKDSVAPLERPAKSLVDKTVVRFNRFQAKRVRIEHLGGAKKESTELLKVGPDWTITGDAPAKVNPQKMDGFLTTLQDMRLVDYGGTGAKNPFLRIVIFEDTSKDGKGEEKETASLSFAPIDGQTVAGSRSGLAKPFTIKMGDFKTINLGKADFTEAPKAAENSATDAKANGETAPAKKPNS